ncbi:hypothetical protein D3C72_809810 [compost metagenome]
MARSSIQTDSGLVTPPSVTLSLRLLIVAISAPAVSRIEIRTLSQASPSITSSPPRPSMMSLPPPPSRIFPPTKTDFTSPVLSAQ